MSRQRDEFDSASAYVSMSDLVGDLVLVTPTEHVEGVQTDFGDKDAILADLVVLADAEGNAYDEPREYTDVMIFQGKLIGQLKRRIPIVNAAGQITREGRPLLARVVKGEAKKGQSAPYEFGSPSEADKQTARNFLAGVKVEKASEPVPAGVGATDDPFAV